MRALAKHRACPPQTHAEKMEQWIRTAPEGLVSLIKRCTLHRKVNWNAPDYITADEFGTDDEMKPVGDGREVTASLEEAEAFSSKTITDAWGFGGQHVLLADIDVEAWLIPSSTDGHGHLVANLMISNEDDLWAFMEAGAKIGLFEPGYVAACKSRGMTSLRLPWIKKGEEPSVVAAADEWAAKAEEWMAKSDDEKVGHLKADCPDVGACLWHAERPFS